MDGQPNATPAHFDSMRGWVVAIGCLVGAMAGFGTIYTFPVFARTMAEEFDTGQGPVQLVFGITVFLFFGTALISGRLYDRIGIRPLVLTGGLLFCSGLVATSTVDALWQGYVLYGVGLGFGGGLFNAPLFALAASWFQRFRAVAQGIVATGSGLGTMVFPPLARWLLERYDWRESMRLLAIVAGGSLAVAFLLVRRAPSMSMGDARRHIRLVVRSGTFWQITSASVLFSTALIGSLGVVVTFVEDEGIANRGAVFLVSVIGAASIGGRLLLTGLANRLGGVLLMKSAFFGLPVAYALWLLSDSQSHVEDRFAVLLVFAVVLGVSYGGFVSLMGDVTAHLFGLLGIGTVMGLLFFSAGVGALWGPPLMGYVADYSDSFIAITLMLSLSALGALVMLPITRDPLPLPTWVGPGGSGPPAKPADPVTADVPITADKGAQPSAADLPARPSAADLQPAMAASTANGLAPLVPAAHDAFADALADSPPRVFWLAATPAAPPAATKEPVS